MRCMYKGLDQALTLLFILPLILLTPTTATVYSIPPTNTCALGAISLLAQNPDRPHSVAAGTITSFVFELRNPTSNPLTTTVSISTRTPGWWAQLSSVDESFQPSGAMSSTLRVPLPARGTITLTLLLRPSSTFSAGARGSATVRASLSAGSIGCAQFSAQVNNRPKIYFTIMDGTSPQYISLNRRGSVYTNTANLLMPTAVNFIKDARWFPAARDTLPAATDMNVYGMLSGSWSGTTGIISVFESFKGWDRLGNPIQEPPAHYLRRWGPTGQPVETIFDVAKDPTRGGDPASFSAFISGKEWVTNYFRDEQSTVNLLVGAKSHPAYITIPQAYRLGDPPSDPNAALDRDGTNLEPPEQYKMILEGFGLYGEQPLVEPSDRWITISTLRSIAVEDPDILVMHLGNTDVIQHAAGSAAWPAAWRDPNGTPALLWDDSSLYNAKANRDPVLDVVYEADYDFGLLLATLRNRNVADRAYTILASDHGLETVLAQPLDVEQLLPTLGIAADVRLTISQDSVDVYLWDATRADAVATAFENYTMPHPLTGKRIHPFIALTRAEMDSGIDNVIGQYARAGGPNRGELYSQWYSKYPVADNSKIVWPDLLVLLRYHLHPLHEIDYIGSHANLMTQSSIIALRGPNISPAVVNGRDATLVDIVPTLYQLLGWTTPPNVDGQSLLAPLPPMLPALRRATQEEEQLIRTLR